MTRKILMILLVIALALSVGLIGCVGQQEEEEEEEEPEPIELNWAIFMPPFAAQVIAYNEWIAKIVDEAADVGYDVTINLYPAGSLLSPDDMYEGVKSGMAEIGDMTLGGDTELFPLSNILCMPFMPVGESEDALDIWLTLQDEFPEMAAEFEDVKVLFYSGSGAEAFLLHCTNQQLLAPEDMAGVTVQSESAMVDLMDDLGAAPITHSNLEWYTDLQTGIFDAMWMNWMAVGEMGLLDFLKYHTIFPSGCQFGEQMIFMNLDTWNSLPSEVQDIIEDQRLWVEGRILELTVGSNDNGHQMAIDAGNSIVTLTPAEEDAWYQAALQIHMDYLADLDAQGLPATEVYDRALELAGH